MRLNAYVLAGDPAWARESLRSYYHLVDSVIVAFDRGHRSWAGHPLQVEQSIRALRSADPDGKIVLLPGDFSDPGRHVLAVETEHRQAALDAASGGCDWVLQLDTDEIVLNADSLIRHLERADADGFDALDFPLRDFYQSLGCGRFLEHSGRSWTIRAHYPGPVAVRSGTTLDHCRQARVPLFRVDLAPRNTDPWHPADATVHAVIPPSDAVAHMSWVRTRDEMERKARTSGYASSRNWDRDIGRWEWRQRHPVATVLANGLRRSNLEWFRISSLDVARSAGPISQPVDSGSEDLLPVNPAVDVVVATNRHTPFLVEALESVVSQSYTNWRLFVVDDGAPDPTALEATVRGVDPDAVVVHQENAGPSAARNRGVGLGSAPLVTFLDDDDVWRRDRLELLVAAVRSPQRPVAVYSGAWYMGPDGRIFDRRRTTQGSTQEMLSGRVPIPFFVTMLFRRDALLGAGGFDERLRWAEDNGLILKILQIGCVVGVDEDLVGYRRHDTNATNASQHKIRAANEQMLQSVIDDAVARADRENCELLRTNRRHLILRYASNAPRRAWHSFRSRDLSGALADLGWALRRAPLATTFAGAGAIVRKLRSR